MKVFIVLALLVLLFPSACALAGTYTAASCSQSDVNAVINGPTHTAVDGDVIIIPGTSCTWASGVVVPSNIGITITGTGTPNSGSGTTGASSSCASGTNITVTGGTTLFRPTPAYGNSTTRLSCMTITSGTGSGIGLSALGTCTSSGCPNLRMDNITFANWAGHVSAGISYGINVVGGMFGVVDHDTINGSVGVGGIQLVEYSNAYYLGVGQYGDNSWHLSEPYGTANFLFFENNTFNTAGCCENEGSAGSDQTYQGGGGVVVRYNQFNNMDNNNDSMGWHGTESNGRPRSMRTWEYYGNTETIVSGNPSVAGARGGTGLTWGNTVNMSGGNASNLFTLTTFRAQASLGGWGPCDGSTVYDGDDGTTYYSGSIGSVSGSGPYVVTVSGASPSWTTNQWSPTGAPYSMHDVTQTNGGEIQSNTGNTLTVATGGGGPGTWTPVNGDSIQILRATWCLDQAGGRGAGILYSGGTASPASSANEVPSPSYFWENTMGAAPIFPLIYPDTLRVIQNRDYYTESLNQGTQTSPTSPFNGTGIGHGTLANRPVTCTASTNSGAVGSAYWETDHNQLDYCTATNTWSTLTSSPQSYVPYTYPHPLDGGGAPSITTSSPLPAATQGVAYSETFAATNSPTSWSCSGCPSWSTFNTGSGVLSGTPNAALGAYSFNITATNGAGSSPSTPLSLTVNGGTCLLTNTVGCECIASQNPCWSTYVGDANTAYTTGLAGIVGVTQPSIAYGSETIGASTAFINQGAPFVTASLEESYINLAVGGTGGSLVFFSPDPLAWYQSTYYAAACASGICATTGSPSSYAAMLASYRSMMQYAIAQGLKIVITWTPISTTWAACSLTSSSMTVAQMDSCLLPLYETAVKDLFELSPTVPIAYMYVTHEPLGIWQLSTGHSPVFTTTQWNTANSALCTGVKAATGWGTAKCGTAFSAAETAYVTSTIANESGTVDAIGQDFYFTAPDSGWNGTLNTYKANCSASVTGGFLCTVNEAQAWPWCPTGSSSCSENSGNNYTSCGDTRFQNAGVNNAFLYYEAHTMSAAGATYVNYFSDQPFVLFSTTGLDSTSNCADTSTSGYTAYILNNLPGSVTAAGQGWQAANQSTNTIQQISGAKMSGGQVK